MLTAAKTGKNLQRFCQESSDLERADQERDRSKHSAKSRVLWVFSSRSTSSTRGDFSSQQRDQTALVAAFGEHCERACQAASAFFADCRAHWPRSDYLSHCETLSQWLEGIYLPLQAQFGWRYLARAVCFSPDLLHRAQHRLPELCAAAACEVSLSARLPFSALEKLARSQSLKSGEIAQVNCWTSDLRHYQRVIDPIVVHLALKHFAKSHRPHQLGTHQERQVAPSAQIAEATCWGQLEVILRSEYRLHLLSRPTALFAPQDRDLADLKTSFCREFSPSFDLGFDHLRGDPLGRSFCLFRSRPPRAAAILLARANPHALLEFFADLPTLSRVATPPRILEIDPLGRYCTFQIQSNDLRPFASDDPASSEPARPTPHALSRAELSAAIHTFSQLRQIGICPVADLWPFAKYTTGPLHWLFPLKCGPFDFHRVWKLMRATAPEGPQLARLAQLSGLSECREAKECSWALRSALDDQSIDLLDRQLPLSWSGDFLSKIERLHSIVREGKSQFARDLAQSLHLPKTQETELDSQRFALQEFDNLVLRAHAEAGFSTCLCTQNPALEARVSPTVGAREQGDPSKWLAEISNRLLLSLPSDEGSATSEGSGALSTS